MSMLPLFKEILHNFPARHMRMAFAYGSGVFQQEGHKDMSQNMIDFIFVVDKPDEWHETNLMINKHHYSFLRFLGSGQIENIQDNFGAKIYFNTLVPCCDRMIKYGVISTASLQDDLLDWENLYVSGRLQKPVNIVHHEPHPDLSAALDTNLRSAVHCALLMQSDRFTEHDLFLTVTGLSYTGDFRMTIGEDKNKIANIVKPNLGRLRELYEGILDNESHLFWNKAKGTFEQNLDAASRFHHLSLLPKMLEHHICAETNKDGRTRDTEEIIHNLAHDFESNDDIIPKCLSRIVNQSSKSQALKGILTAGVRKTTLYSYAKLQKMWKSKNKS